MRPVAGIDLPVSGPLTLATDRRDVLARFGDCKEIEVLPNITRIRLDRQHLSLLLSVGRDAKVIAIILSDPQSPPIPLRGQGIASTAKGELRVGMSRAEIEALLGHGQSTPLLDPKQQYEYYRALGLAVLYINDRGQELVIVQLPK